MAASQAFTASQSPQQKLSASAAAAALRSMSPAPIPVSQVQTKRMVERQNSGANRGRTAASAASGIQRRASSSSMTGRSFRSPSPGRPVTTAAVSKPRSGEPPVPQLPNLFTSIPPIPQKSHRRSVSVDDYQSQRSAPKASLPAGSRNSIATQPPSKAATAASLAAKRVTNTQNTSSLTRTDSHNSINFSYPGRARPQSPPPPAATKQPTPTASQNNTPSKSKQSAPKPKVQSPTQTTPPSLSSLALAEAENIQYDVSQASQVQTKRKPKTVDPQMAEGRHLTNGTMGAKPKVTPLGPAPPSDAQSEDEESPRLSARPVKTSGQGSHFHSDARTGTDSDASDSDTTSERSRQKRAQRASGALVKQPSIVREDWDGEKEEEAASPTEPRFVSRTTSPQPGQTSQTVGKTKPLRSVEESPVLTKAQKLVVQESSAQRVPSLSPSRSARFSNRLSSDMTQGRKHEPLPRSVSPGKSALKNSPRILAADLSRARAGSLTPSEGTDLSADDSNLRKKAVHHVSFDNEPVIGYAASNEIPTTPVTATSQTREGRNRSDETSNKPISHAALAAFDDEDDAMKPRPQLPTFGSVRKNRNEQESRDSVADKSRNVHQRTSPSSSSSASSINNPATMDTSVSSDHAIGVLLSRDSLQKPTEPQDAAVPGPEPVSIYAQATVAPDPTAVTSSAPIIALHPATPNMEEGHHKDQWLVEVPGGFPGHAQPAAIAAPLSANRATTVSHEEPEQEPAFPIIQHQRMPSIQEESDRDSIYSDAAEDLSEVEGDGFGSINAIVRSPVSPASPRSKATPPESPSVVPSRKEGQFSESRAMSWDDTSARWSQLATSVKTANLQPAAPIIERQTPSESRKKAAPPTIQRQFSESDSDYSPPVRKSRAPRDQPPSLKKSLRSEPQQNGVDSKPVMRESMRLPQESTITSKKDVNVQQRQGPVRMAQTVQTTRTTAPIKTGAVASAAATAPASTNASVMRATPSLPTKTMRTGASPSASRGPGPAMQAVKPALPPVNNDSDSDSSFRKRRRNKSNDTGVRSMRRSMRAEPSPAPAPSRQQVRSMSPVQRRPFSSASNQPATLRSSMRGSVDSGAPTLRGQPEGKRSSSLFGRNRKAMSPTRAAAATGFGKSKSNQSRFANDSDDEPTARKPFESRINDSSDEEDLPPVRGIPRRPNRQDSTDLEDSSDDERKRGKPSRKNNLSTITPVSGTAIRAEPPSPTSPSTKQKRGFFGRLRRSRADSIDTPDINGSTTTQTAVAKGTSKEARQLGFRSNAEQEALIAETQRKLEAGRIREGAASPSPDKAKLLRRATPQRIMSDSWPLPPKIPAADSDRPHTADGVEDAAVALQARPGLGSRQDTVNTQASKSGTVVSQKTGKKKRFPMLRRAFGLKD